MNNDLKQNFLKQLQQHSDELKSCERFLKLQRYENLRQNHMAMVVHKLAGLLLTFGYKEEGDIAQYVEIRIQKAFEKESYVEIDKLLPLISNVRQQCLDIIDGESEVKPMMNYDYNLDDELAGKKVLLVDDDPVILTLMKSKMLQVGFEVALAKDGQEALNILSKESFDCVVLDQNMPHKTGLEVAQVLQGERKAGVPIFLLTGYSVEEIEKLAIPVNVKHVFQKPFKLELVVGKIKEYFTG
ncbi:MAG: response regulator [Pseudomonadota bacterium]|nr:response regulator [Pseudomonadota bacterium]